MAEAAVPTTREARLRTLAGEASVVIRSSETCLTSGRAGSRVTWDPSWTDTGHVFMFTLRSERHCPRPFVSVHDRRFEDPGCRLAGRRRDGQGRTRHRLVRDSARPYRVVAAEPAHDRQPLPRIEFPDQHHLGPGPDPDLQRRLLANLWRQASAIDGSGLQGVLVLRLAGDWRGVRTGRRRAGRLPREQPHVPRPVRLPGGNLLHVLLQPDSR